MSNEKKSATLGMPHGTAANRLRKNILFSLLKKHSENICVRCNNIIESVDELSIEHLKPWEGISADLFWDLENIAFSHVGCNVPHSRRSGGGNRKKIGPEGTAWCTPCQKFEPVENFWKDKGSWDGLQKYCKTTKHLYRQNDLSACGEKANAEGLNPSAHNELTGSTPV